VSHLTLEYLLFVFIASCGVLQLTAAYSKLKGLLFFQSRIVTCIFALLVIGGAYAWFIGWGTRLQERIMHPGIEGFQQVYCFLLAAVVAIIFTLIISSMINRKSLSKSGKEEREGLEKLKEENYFKAIRHSLMRSKSDNPNHSE
jgi:hypothetical protein